MPDVSNDIKPRIGQLIQGFDRLVGVLFCQRINILYVRMPRANDLAFRIPEGERQADKTNPDADIDKCRPRCGTESVPDAFRIEIFMALWTA